MAIYNGKKDDTLNGLWLTRYCKKMAKSFNKVEPRSLPPSPSSLAAKYYSYQVFLQICQSASRKKKIVISTSMRSLLWISLCEGKPPYCSGWLWGWNWIIIWAMSKWKCKYAPKRKSKVSLNICLIHRSVRPCLLHLPVVGLSGGKGLSWFWNDATLWIHMTDTASKNNFTKIHM